MHTLMQDVLVWYVSRKRMSNVVIFGVSPFAPVNVPSVRIC